MFENLLRPSHLIIILIIALLFFGPAKIAGIGTGLGEGIANFKKAMRDGEKKSEEGGEKKDEEKK